MTRIIIFAKAPLPGRVKTRLIPMLGDEGAAALAARMLVRTLEEALASEVGPVELCGDPDPDHRDWDPHLRPFRSGLQTSAQGEGDLGERLARATRRAIDGGEKVMLIGSDCPALDRERLVEAEKLLAEADAVIHPARDGGYVLLGLSRYDPSLFEDSAWSTSIVAETTIERMRALGWSVRVAATLQDVDEPADLAALDDVPVRLGKADCTRQKQA